MVTDLHFKGGDHMDEKKEEKSFMDYFEGFFDEETEEEQKNDNPNIMEDEHGVRIIKD